MSRLTPLDRLLKSLADDLAKELDIKYSARDLQSEYQIRYDREMQDVVKAREYLAKKEAELTIQRPPQGV